MTEASVRLGLYKGQSVHGFRRGSIQHNKARGVSEGEVARRAQIKTPAVLARYANKRRHLPRLEKKALAAKLARQHAAAEQS